MKPNISTDFKQIPMQYRDCWEIPDTLPETLIHFTTPNNAREILETGVIKPMDPAPEAWGGAKAVFFFDPLHPEYDQELERLLDHFFKKSEQIYSLWIKPNFPLLHGLSEGEKSHYITMQDVRMSNLKNHHDFMNEISTIDL